MFQASVEGELYDPEQWAKYYKPYGFEYNGDDAVTAKPAAKPASVKIEDKVEAKPEIKEEAPEAAAPEASAENSGEQSVQDILALVRSRNKSE